MKLIVKLFVGIGFGILIGLYSPDLVLRFMETIKVLFGNFLNFFIPFIVVFFVASGIVGLGSQSGRITGYTLGIVYISTLLAGFLAYYISSWVLPHFTVEMSAVSHHGGEKILPFLNIPIEPLMSVISALVFAFLFGIGAAKTESTALKNIFNSGTRLVDWAISKFIIPFLPIYIATIFANLAAEGTVFSVLKIFATILLVVVLTQWLWLLIQYSVAGIITKRNPVPYFRNMMPAYMTALGTMSSAATIPVTMRCMRNNKFSQEMTDFLAPLCATIHISGSMITIVTCALAVIFVTAGLTLPPINIMVGFIFMLAVMMVAAAGVPGGGILAAIGILNPMLGFDETSIGIMIALYMAQDSFGTATNVTGDGAIAMIVTRGQNG